MSCCTRETKELQASEQALGEDMHDTRAEMRRSAAEGKSWLMGTLGAFYLLASKWGEISTTFEAKRTKSARNMEIDSGESRWYISPRFVHFGDQ